jgi:simple sugar transport system substrate-binding protein
MKNRVVAIALLLSLLVTVLPAASALAAQPPAQDNPPLRITFVTHDLGAGIFVPVRTGMEDACAMIGAECEFIGPQVYDISAHVSMIEAAIEKKPDAICTTRPEPGAFDDVLKKAQDAGILVITYNTNDPTADEVLPLPFVGQNFTVYGQEWARHTMKIMPDGGQIAITDCCLGHYALEERMRAFKETLETEGQGKWQVTDIISITTDETKGYAAVEAYYKSHPEVDAIMGVDYYTYVTAQFIRNEGLQGKLITGGSDLAPAMIDGLKEGYVAFGIGQNPYLQGFHPVMMVYMAKKYGIRPVSIDTGVDIVTPENIDQYNPQYR